MLYVFQQKVSLNYSNDLHSQINFNYSLDNKIL